MSVEIAAIVMFVIVIALIMIGNHVAWAMGSVSLLFGLFLFGESALYQAALSVYGVVVTYPFVAVSLFVLMGTLLQQTGVADKLFESVHMLTANIKGGLALATVIIAAIFGACTGIAGASVVTIGLLAMPSMLKARYNRGLVAGTICAGGGLGVIIPPSIVAILYGPNAGVSIAALFTACIVPGVLLTILYLGYIYLRCRINPEMGPPLNVENKMSKAVLLRQVAINLIPPIVLILGVMGSIMFGIAAPTEAASVGVLGSLALALFYKKLSWKNFKLAILDSTRITAMVIFIAVGAKIFTTFFLNMEGGALIQEAFGALKVNPLMTLIAMLLLNFILGMVFDWIGIIFILVPLYVPIIASLGFDPLWFGVLFCVVLQISYMTPPFAYSIFYLRGVAPPEMTLNEMYRGGIPFVIIQTMFVILLIIFPQIVLWLPSLSLAK